SSPIRFRKELQGCASLRSIFPACRRARSSSRFISVDFTRQCFQAALAEHPCAEGFLPAGGRLLLPAAVGGGERVDFIGSPCARQLNRLRLRHPRLRRGDTSTYGGKQVARWLKKIAEPFLLGLDAGEIKAFVAGRIDSDLGRKDLEMSYLRTKNSTFLP